MKHNGYFWFSLFPTNFVISAIIEAGENFTYVFSLEYA